MEFQGLKKPNSKLLSFETRVSPWSLSVWFGVMVSRATEELKKKKQKSMKERNSMVDQDYWKSWSDTTKI